MVIAIELWKYVLTLEADGRFRVRHQITPADAGYGTEVDIHLPADYFDTHSVKKFYEHVAPMQHCRPRKDLIDKNAEIAAIKAQLAKVGILH